MTGTTSGTINAVTAALGMPASQITTYLAVGPPFSITNYPPNPVNAQVYPTAPPAMSPEHGGFEENWVAPEEFPQYNAIFTQANYTYRI